ncbi:hypothetical protein K402DRAFT_423001 [Aulographum hederae CBS 113979]|uniref:NADH dehydrogenase [ubiquinone] 1 alpha subcomplex subunit 1 n=1 Tax=Aulographum hederae CBS 113979 TaxID=1176131 RepID=A0A6G1GTA1_9PEZI|nr:hypothetical protein K402DRAFT_423001 [Aulographum hederae CBS 113979]
MGVPFETLLPYGVILVMFGITGGALGGLQHMQNGGKRGRHNTDMWDRVRVPIGFLEWRGLMLTSLQQMMDRDRRLTGYLRGQSDRVEAAPGYELNSAWRCEKRFL